MSGLPAVVAGYGGLLVVHNHGIRVGGQSWVDRGQMLVGGWGWRLKHADFSVLGSEVIQVYNLDFPAVVIGWEGVGRVQAVE